MKGDNSSSETAYALQIFGADGAYTEKEFDDGSVTETFTGTASQIATMKLYGTEGTYAKHRDAEGNVSETFTGTGRWTEDLNEQILENAQRAAQDGSAPQVAAKANAYIEAVNNGTLKIYDMSTMGVTATMTVYSSNRGSGADIKIDGMDAFIEKSVIINNGEMFDKATGKNASISQSGTQFLYSVW